MILDEIVQTKRAEIASAKSSVPQREIEARARAAGPTRPFLAKRRPGGPTQIVAEIKRRSPSKGLIRADFDPAAIGRVYEREGAAAISILTDGPYFGGANAFVGEVRAATERAALLRKEFIVDPYQVYESRAIGADAILLIASILDEGLLKDLLGLAGELDLGVLVEVHDAEDLAKALAARPRVVGINNRDLRTFEVDVGTTARLMDGIPPETVIVAESGIDDRRAIEYLEARGVDAFLVGEALMRAPDIGARLRDFLGTAGAGSTR